MISLLVVQPNVRDGPANGPVEAPISKPQLASADGFQVVDRTIATGRCRPKSSSVTTENRR